MSANESGKSGLTAARRTYRTPLDSGESRLIVKGSKFIGYCTAAADEIEAQEIIARRSRLNHSATHNCWAYRVGDCQNPAERSADAGEPSGTAGRPILDQLKKADIVNGIVIVSRWFGGTKLGKGGLARAYAECTAACLEVIRTRQVRSTQRITVTCDYPLIGLVENLLGRLEGSVKEGDYGEQATLECELPSESLDDFRRMLIDESAGKISI